MLLTFYFNKMYGSSMANKEIDKVNNLLFELFVEYDIENIDR